MALEDALSTIHPEDWLRSLPSLTGTAPETTVFSAPPSDPIDLFLDWIREAAAIGVHEPHAATLATVDADGVPDARTLLLKDVGVRGWAFAGPRASAKGAQLTTRPAAALNFWWQPLVRAVRVRGTVQEASPAESDADLAARSEAARADLEPGQWVRWWLHPTRIEFWQGATDRRHRRLVYERATDGWRARVLTGELSGEPTDQAQERNST